MRHVVQEITFISHSLFVSELALAAKATRCEFTDILYALRVGKFSGSVRLIFLEFAFINSASVGDKPALALMSHVLKLTFVDVSIGELVPSTCVKSTLGELARVYSSVWKGHFSFAVLSTFDKGAFESRATRCDLDSLAVGYAIRPVAFVRAAVCSGELAFPMLLGMDHLADVVVPAGGDTFAVSMRDASFPFAIVRTSICERHLARALVHVLEEVSFINISVFIN